MLYWSQSSWLLSIWFLRELEGNRKMKTKKKVIFTKNSFDKKKKTFNFMSYIIFLKVTFKLILRSLVRLFTALCKMVVLCIRHKILHRYIYTMCMATKAYLLGRSLCNASHWPLKVYTFESERLFELFFCIEYSLKIFKQNKNHTSPYILLKLIIFCRRRKT